MKTATKSESGRIMTNPRVCRFCRKPIYLYTHHDFDGSHPKEWLHVYKGRKYKAGEIERMQEDKADDAYYKAVECNPRSSNEASPL